MRGLSAMRRIRVMPWTINPYSGAISATRRPLNRIDDGTSFPISTPSDPMNFAMS